LKTYAKALQKPRDQNRRMGHPLENKKEQIPHFVRDDNARLWTMLDD
jgi:hypothetical protein